MTGVSSGVRREIAGVAWIILAVFLAGAVALQPVDPYTSCAAATGRFGPVGACLKAATQGALGASTTWLLPLLPLLHGLRVLRRIPQDADRRWTLFTVGLLALLPIAIGLWSDGTPRPDSPGGLWGGFVSFYLRRALGTAGGWLALLMSGSALTAWSLRWNPVRMVIGSAASAQVKPPLAAVLEPPPEEMPAVEGYVPAEPARPLAVEPTVDQLAERRKRKEKKAVPAPAAPVPDVAVVAPILVSSEDALAYALPSPELLTPAPPSEPELGKRELEAMGVKLMDALRTFKVEGTLVDHTVGPVVTQFEIEPAPGVKVRQFANLANDLALAMRASSIRVVAPIPGRGAVGVEVPNPTPQVVAFRALIESPEFQNARMALPLALGRDLEGRPVVTDLARMPHLLIAGATGSGKSVCVNTIITSLVYRHTPETLQFLMVDPKMVELSVYNALPHLLHKVITDNRDAAYVLKWAVMTMQKRYELLAANGARNIQEFNKRVLDGAPLIHPRRADVAFEREEYKDGIMPYVVLVIDELADLMMTVQGEVETPLAMLAQKARAIGIHIILATQRPSVNVITGLIKANFPSRIAFRVASQIDSRTIIDGMGAESLLGNGDMLFIPPGKSEPQRLQGAYIPGEDTEHLTAWFTARTEARQDALRARGAAGEELRRADIIAEMKAQEALDREDEEESSEGEGQRDPIFRKAAETCIQHQLGSTSLLQRRLGIGYGRAARVIDQLHAAGVLGPPNGSKPREILIGLDDLDRIVPQSLD
ncbi:MAG: DNA translocase FtsK 4TM domain-containing protein [Gemmatimonadetes bacterium]|nr:DNA translocase FtsK 4TM domain-containing protein [Gemmatimonadota bacterium]